MSGQIATHNADTGAHSDIRKLIQDNAGYTKVETLTDTTKAKFGLSTDAVPDDVLALLPSWFASTDVKNLCFVKITSSTTWKAPKTAGNLLKVVCVGGGGGGCCCIFWYKED